MAASMDKAIICYQRRSKSSNSSMISSHMVGNHAAAAEASDPRFHQLRRRKKSRKFPIQEHWDEDKPLQQILSACMGRKRVMRMADRENVTVLHQHIFRTEIFPRLATKYILRCRLVCKSWNSYLSSSDFVNSQGTPQLHHKQEDDLDLIIAKCFAKDEGISILSRDNVFGVRKVPCVCDNLLGSINGLILMSSTRGRRFCLWNPAMGQVKFFQMHPSHHHPNNDNEQCVDLFGGFCWDHVQNDYKAVMCCYDYKTSPPSQLLCIYSFNSATWTPLRIPRHPMLTGFRYNPNLMMHPSTIVKGTPYWSYSEYVTFPGKRRRRKFFYTFKFVPEINEFRFLPDFKFNTENFILINIKDRLVGMAYDSTYRENILVAICSLDDEESDSGVWRKMYTIGPVCGSSCRPSHCFKNGGEILIRKLTGPFSLYDPKTNETKEYDDSSSTATAPRIRMYYSYTPSLICVRGMESMQNLSTKDGFETYRYVTSALPCFTRD